MDCITRLPPGLLCSDPLITYGTHTSKCVCGTDTHTQMWTHKLWAEGTLVSPHTGFEASVGILWLVWAEDSGGFPAALQSLLSPLSLPPSLCSFPSAFLSFSFPPLFPLPTLPALPTRPQGQKYPVVSVWSPWICFCSLPLSAFSFFFVLLVRTLTHAHTHTYCKHTALL